MRHKGIIISGKPCSGKSVLCKMLSKEFSWEIYYLGQIWRERWKVAHPNAEVSFEEYWRGTSDEDNIQINVDAKKIMEQRELIVDSRYSAFYCKDIPYLKVFLDADLEVRVERAMKKEGANTRDADKIKEILMNRETDEFLVGMKLFKEDYRDSRHYDVVLDSSNLTVEKEFNYIKSHLKVD